MSKVKHSYACPNCGSIHLQVSVTARAALTQDEEDGNLQTCVFGDHEWDNDSPMECSDCQYSGSARHFIVPHRLRLYERLAQNTQFQKLPMGGGCTALCAEIGPVSWMITDTEGGNYAPGFDEPVFLGMYDKETGDIKLEIEFSNLGGCLDWFRKNAAGEVNWFSENAAGEANSHDPKA